VPEIPAARREQNPAPPAPRNAWYCRYCPGYPKPKGYAQNAKAAELAGLRHFHVMHDHPSTTPGQEPHA